MQDRTFDGVQPDRAGAVPVVMTPELTDAEAALDAEWRQAFDQPLPMLGALEIARSVLDQHWAKVAQAA